MRSSPLIFFFFFFNDTATTEIYTLSLHDALPISGIVVKQRLRSQIPRLGKCFRPNRIILFSAENSEMCGGDKIFRRSEEHTSELQSRLHLVCRLLLEKKKNHNNP